MSKLTADTITDEQIHMLHAEETERLVAVEATLVEAREKLLTAGRNRNDAVAILIDAGCALAVSGGSRAYEARARCAEILNGRAENK